MLILYLRGPCYREVGDCHSARNSRTGAVRRSSLPYSRLIDGGFDRRLRFRSYTDRSCPTLPAYVRFTSAANTSPVYDKYFEDFSPIVSHCSEIYSDCYISNVNGNLKRHAKSWRDILILLIV